MKEIIENATAGGPRGEMSESKCGRYVYFQGRKFLIEKYKRDTKNKKRARLDLLEME